MSLERQPKEKRISARSVIGYAIGAARLRRALDITNPVERFNAGLYPLAEDGSLSSRPGTAIENNASDFYPLPTNQPGTLLVKTRINHAILSEEDRKERQRLGTIRDSLQAEQLTSPISRTTESGDYVRRIPETEKYTDPETGQIIRFVRYNWDKRISGGTVTVSLPPYNTRVDKNSTASVRDAELAAQMTDRPMIAIMHPGMGSGKLTKQQREELGTKAGYFSIADAQLKVLTSLGVGPEDKIDLVGESMGAYAALAVATRATKNGFTINRVVLSELPGVEERAPKELGKAMMDSGKYLATAWAGPFDPYIYESGLLHRSVIRQQLESVKWLGRMLLNDPAIHNFPYGRAMAKETATDRLQQVLADNPGSNVVLVTGTDDMVSRISAVNQTINNLRTLGFGKERISRVFFEGGTHSVMENPMRRAGLLKQALTAEYKAPEKAA